MRALLLAFLLVVSGLAGCASTPTDPTPAENNSTSSSTMPDNMTMSVATIEMGETPAASGAPSVGPNSMYMTVKGFDAMVGHMMTINITNKGTITHDVVIEGTDFKSGDVAPGKSITKTWTPTKDGTFMAYCDKGGAPVPDPSGQDVGSHRSDGMHASITVKKAA